MTHVRVRAWSRIAALTLAIAAAAAVPAPAAPAVRMHLGAHLMAFEQRACDQRAAAIAAPASDGGAATYRADVAWRAAEDVARALRRATGHAPAMVARDDRGACTGRVPAVSRKAVRTDGVALVRRWQRRLCLAVQNQNYEVDKAATAETRRVVRRLTADLPARARPKTPCATG